MRISDWSSDVCSSDLAFELLLDPFFYAARASFCLFELCLVIERLRFATWTNHPGIADLHDPSNVTVIVKAKEYPTRHSFHPLILVHSYQGGRQVSAGTGSAWGSRSEEHKSELQSPMRNSNAFFCWQKQNINQ